MDRTREIRERIKGAPKRGDDPWDVAPYSWILVGHQFVECDVIRWIEAVWERKGPKRHTRIRKIGEREIVAEVVEEDEEEGWVYLHVLKSRVTWFRAGFWKRRIRGVPEGEVIKRKRHSISRKSESVWRLPWSDESAREAVAAAALERAERAAKQDGTPRAEQDAEDES